MTRSEYVLCVIAFWLGHFLYLSYTVFSVIQLPWKFGTSLTEWGRKVVNGMAAKEKVIISVDREERRYLKARKSPGDNPHPSIPKHLPAAARNNQRAQSTDHETSKGKQQHHSAPINIPDWSKIYRTSGAGDNYGGGGCTEEEGSEHDDEWISKKLASFLHVQRVKGLGGHSRAEILEVFPRVRTLPRITLH